MLARRHFARPSLRRCRLAQCRLQVHLPRERPLPQWRPALFHTRFPSLFLCLANARMFSVALLNSWLEKLVPSTLSLSL